MKLNSKTSLVLLALLLAAGAAAYFVAGRVPFEQQKPAVGDMAPGIALSDINGAMTTLSDYKGKVVLVNFWASWCPPCKAEMPGFQKVLFDYESRGFAVLSIALDDLPFSVVRELAITFPVLKISDRVKRDYGAVSDVPQSFLISREGRIIKKIWKVYDEKTLRADLDEALR